MSIASTILHIQGRAPEQIEATLTNIFTREERPSALRVEGSYTAVLARVDDPEFDAAYRYLLLRPHGAGAWAPLLELGQRTEGLDVELPEVALPDDSGLFGAWSSTALASCLGPATTFASRDAVEALRREDGGFLGRLLGPNPSRRREAVAAWSSEELWGHWATLAEAVRTTGANDYLGWFLSA